MTNQFDPTKKLKHMYMYLSSLISHPSFQKGQALITLLFFAIIGITITSAAVVMMMVNSISGSKFQQGIVAYHIAESGAENGLLRLLRNPSYTGENDLPIGTGTADITVTGDGSAGNPFIITSSGQIGSFVRNIEIRATYVSNLLTVTSEREVF